MLLLQEKYTTIAPFADESKGWVANMIVVKWRKITPFGHS